jgi:preprotein translocase subunit YajC
MVDVVFAQTGPGIGGPGALMSVIPLVLVFMIFYFLLIRPQQKKAKQHGEMLAKLKKNDEVVTSGGIYGKVVTLNEKDNTVTLEIAPNVRIKFSRPQVSSVVKGEKNQSREVKEQ